MLLAGKAVGAGIAVILLTIGTSGTRPSTLPSEPGLSKEGPGWAYPNDVTKMQQTLRDKGHYRGEVDGVFGLRTRASIRGFQKVEHLPMTGQLDASTAVKLGVRLEVREATGYGTTQGKPSAGIKWGQGSGRTSKTLRKSVKRTPLPLFSCAESITYSQMKCSK
jgi:peptidoglycan hydrolase-like protein with peptidoglycan-binding domain